VALRALWFVGSDVRRPRRRSDFGNESGGMAAALQNQRSPANFSLLWTAVVCAPLQQPAIRQPTTRAKRAVCDTSSPQKRGVQGMDDIDREGNGGDDDEQFEQMIVENSILLHSLAALLVRKGIIKQEEIDAEMDKLYDEMEKFDGE
jgi:hypothetical protein